MRAADVAQQPPLPLAVALLCYWDAVGALFALHSSTWPWKRRSQRCSWILLLLCQPCRGFAALRSNPRARPICQEKLKENDVAGPQSCFSILDPVTLSSDVTTKVNCPAKDGVSQYRTNHLYLGGALVYHGLARQSFPPPSSLHWLAGLCESRADGRVRAAPNVCGSH